MTRRIAAVLLLAAAAVFLPLAAPAAADDAAVWNAYNRENPEVVAAAREWDRAMQAWERSEGRRWRPAARASRRLARLAAGVQAEITAQTASSPEGEQAKKLAVASIRELQRAYSLTASAITYTARGSRAGIRQGKRADRAFARAARYHRRAVSAFRALGLT